MTNPFQQFNRETCFRERRRRNVSVAIQLPFFGKRFLAAARRSCTISRSSLPSQNLITSLAKAIRCSTWKLNGRPRRRHISSSSARCSSDMRMLYRRFFFATHKGCQSKVINTWRKRVDNGRQWLNLNGSLFPKRYRKRSGRNGDSCHKILGSDESSDSSHAAGAKGGQLPKG
jgi:hypothetical protein